MNLAGKKFNKLIALSVAKSNRLGLYWNCLCECGNKTIVRAAQLNFGQYQSCGCLRKENIKKIAGHNKKPKGESAFSKLLSRYRYKAKERDLIFALTRMEFDKLVQGVCYYCNEPPNQKETTSAGDIFVYNGIDRLDNSIGYTLENCVSCCGFCNFMKRERNVENFLNHVKLIFETRIKQWQSIEKNQL